MKKPITRIFIHFSNFENYHISVQRGDSMDVTRYSVKAESVVLDYISKLNNDGKVKARMDLSVYPTINIRPTYKLKQVVSKATYDGTEQRQELCQFIKNHLNEIYSEIALARKNEMSFASNEDVNAQDFDNLFHVIAAVYRECDRIEMDGGAEDEYGYAQQGKSFD